MSESPGVKAGLSFFKLNTVVNPVFSIFGQPFIMTRHFITLLLLLLLLSCSNKPDIVLQYQFSEHIIDYDGSDKYDTRIGYREFFPEFAVMNYEVAHADFVATDSTVNVWKDGKLVKRYNDFSYTHGYGLKKYKVSDFIYDSYGPEVISHCSCWPKDKPRGSWEISIGNYEYSVFEENGKNFVAICDKDKMQVLPLRDVENSIGPPIINFHYFYYDKSPEMFVYTPIADYREAKAYCLDVYSVTKP
ncbi:hypothetical protein HYN59_02430 [Flavobacterium album]|uniref:Uncharacterized protein n=1 Tax=Flavobacterium album TaxID=2175091 RepID=A0A2S1QUH4_9FLAO|nr:hypothetical protein [Flavobacterium album]AWH84035.1 hypothetical protein HYN59_02430 [Flavobacterium album]